MEILDRMKESLQDDETMPSHAEEDVRIVEARAIDVVGLRY